MYGIINKAIEGLVTDNYGEAVWQQMKLKSAAKVTNLIASESYDDMETYQMAVVASEILETPVQQVLFNFGERWITMAGIQYYGLLMQAERNDLGEFLVNLPAFHNRVMIMYPNISPPEFKIIVSGDRKVELHNYSTREGLTDFMNGLIAGMGKLYHENPVIQLKNGRTNGLDHEEIIINW
ncbi:MAG: hypothetical protein RL060_1822 [Bacteroidota bacterium]|jgi:hypothetical protein